MTRHELNQLQAIYNDLVSRTVQIGDMIIAALREQTAEDRVNTSLEKSKGNGDDHKPRSI